MNRMNSRSGFSYDDSTINIGVIIIIIIIIIIQIWIIAIIIFHAYVVAEVGRLSV